MDGDVGPPRQASHGAFIDSKYGTLVLLLSRFSNRLRAGLHKFEVPAVIKLTNR
jgi:hypothetical protein